MAFALSSTLGGLALVATIVVICINLILALRVNEANFLKWTSVFSTALEFASVVFLICFYLVYALPTRKQRSIRFLGVAFGVGLILCMVSGAGSVVMLVCLNRRISQPRVPITDIDAPDFLIGSSVSVGLCLVFQLLFLVVQFSSARAMGLGLGGANNNGRPPIPHVKSIPYDQTAPAATNIQEMKSMGSSDRSSPKRINVFKATVSQAIHTSASKTRLLPSKERRRPMSLDSTAYDSSCEDTFDSWDTSSVDVHNRRVVLEASSPSAAKTQFLETIPASPPTSSRSQSPGSPLDIEPPRILRRSWSYSTTMSKEGPRSLSPQSSHSELHIHPLFRSDSPTRPAIATPGTSVIASPHQDSMRSLTRARSGSLPAFRSPLTRQYSSEEEQGGGSNSLGPSRESQDASVERKMTPPVPEWLLKHGGQ